MNVDVTNKDVSDLVFVLEAVDLDVQQVEQNLAFHFAGWDGNE